MRYLKLYLNFIRFSFSRDMEFRIDFFFRIFMDLIFYTMNIIFFKIIYLHTDSIGGLNQNQVMVFVGSFLVVDALEMTIFSNNMWWLPIFVNKGDLDYYLTRPVSSRFFLSLRSISTNSFINFLFACMILIWAFSNDVTSYNSINFILYILFLLLGLYIKYLIRMLFIIPVFWMHSTRGLDEIYFSLSHIEQRPHRIFKGYVLKIITYVLPFSLIASYPVDNLYNGLNWTTFSTSIFITILFSIIIHILWSIALKNYSSASS